MLDGMASTGEPWRLGHRPALDGVRGIAVLLVMLQHAHTPGFATAGVVGVTMFFTLSGFLITTLLLEEWGRAGRLNYGRFYLRRALRLLPALLAVVTVVSMLGIVLGRLWVTPGRALAAVFYMSNFASILHGPGYDALAHTWSLSMEEQFYLLWPLLLPPLLKWDGRRAAVVVASCGVAASMILRPIDWDGGSGWNWVQYNPMTHADGLLVGCLLALALSNSRRVFKMPGHVPMFGLVGLLAVSLWPGGFMEVVVAPGVVPLLTALVILGSVRLRAGIGVLSWKPLREVGRRSYGLYLWHYPVAVLIDIIAGKGGDASWMVELPILFPAAAVLTWLSWRFIESPFLSMKGRIARSAEDPIPAAPRLLESHHVA